MFFPPLYLPQQPTPNSTVWDHKGYSAILLLMYNCFFLKTANAVVDGPKRVPVSQHSAQSRLLNSGGQAQRVLCPSNYAQRVPVQSQKSVLSNQKLSNNQTTQQPRPKFLVQPTARPQVPSKTNEKPQQAPAPGNSEDDVHIFIHL